MRALFKNPKAAALYAGITVIGAGIAIGTTDSPGSLQNTVTTLGGPSAQDKAAERKFGDDIIGGPTRRKSREQAPVEFATDEDLVDDASGFNPTPDSEDYSGYDPAPAGEEPYLADQDKNKEKDGGDSGGWGVPLDD